MNAEVLKLQEVKLIRMENGNVLHSWIFNMDNLAIHLGRKIGVSRQTIWRALRAYRRWGVAGLDRRRRRDAGRSRFFSRHRELGVFVICTYFKGGVTFRGTYLALLAVCAERREKAPTYATVSRFLRCVEFDVARAGGNAG
jgi:hypothetical protein